LSYPSIYIGYPYFFGFPIKLVPECFYRVTFGNDKSIMNSCLSPYPNAPLKTCGDKPHRVTRGNDNLRRISAEVQGILIYWFFYRKTPLLLT